MSVALLEDVELRPSQALLSHIECGLSRYDINNDTDSDKNNNGEHDGEFTRDMPAMSDDNGDDNGNDTNKGNQKHADIDTDNAHSMFALCGICHNPCLLTFWQVQVQKHAIKR